jgi:hypothetical protein
MTSASAPKTVKGSKAAISPAPIVSDRATTAPDLATTEDIATPAHRQIMIARAIVTITSVIVRQMVKELKVATVNPEVATGGIKTTNGNRTMANGDVSSPALPRTIHARAIAIMTSASAPKTVKGLKVATINPEVVTGGIKTTNGNRTMANGDVSSPALLPIIHARVIATTISASVLRTAKRSYPAILKALKSTFRYWNFLLVCLYIGIICKDPK